MGRKGGGRSRKSEKGGEKRGWGIRMVVMCTEKNPEPGFDTLT